MWVRFIGVAAALFLVAACEREKHTPRAVVVSEDGSMEVSAMTFNIRYENSGDKGWRNWGERVVGIVKMLRAEQPDFLGIQEGLHGQVADLRASLPDYGFVGTGRSDGGREGEYSGIFYQRDRFAVDGDKSGMTWLSDSPDKAGSMTWGNDIPRVATWARLLDRTSGQRIWVVNMHLDHRNQPSREKGVSLMAERLVRMNPDEDPVVWMGDFNAVEGNSAVAFLGGKRTPIAAVKGFDGMVETFDVLNAGVKERGTLHFWMSDPNREWKVDHIFISKGGEVLRSGILRGGEPYLSDHFPVTATVRFPPR